MRHAGGKVGAAEGAFDSHMVCITMQGTRLLAAATVSALPRCSVPARHGAARCPAAARYDCSPPTCGHDAASMWREKCDGMTAAPARCRPATLPRPPAAPPRTAVRPTRRPSSRRCRCLLPPPLPCPACTRDAVVALLVAACRSSAGFGCTSVRQHHLLCSAAAASSPAQLAATCAARGQPPVAGACAWCCWSTWLPQLATSEAGAPLQSATPRSSARCSPEPPAVLCAGRFARAVHGGGHCPRP
jgi:hypothetical protein